jgi:hypothetical protein
MCANFNQGNVHHHPISIINFNLQVLWHSSPAIFLAGTFDVAIYRFLFDFADI